jgi:hypothetical protein
VRTKNVVATEIAQESVKAINAHDTDGLTKLMSSNHVFIDSLGNRFPASAMRSGWQEYFTMVPDYHDGDGCGISYAAQFRFMHLPVQTLEALASSYEFGLGNCHTPCSIFRYSPL